MTSIGKANVPQRVDPLGGVDDADEQGRGCRDDLLAGQRAAAAFRHLERPVDLVGAIDIERQLLDVAEVEHRDTQPSSRAALRCELATAPRNRVRSGARRSMK